MANILVVDDDPVSRDLVSSVLTYGGHRLEKAGDGAEGLEMARRSGPELIIADLLMPTMDGFEFVRRLRDDPTFSRTPVVFYTASYLADEARNLAHACGVAHILSKPADPDEILGVVGNLLGEQQRPTTAPPLEEFRWEHLQLLIAKLSQRAEHAVPRFNAMIQFGLELASERDRRRLLRNFSSSARKIIGARYGIVGLLDPSVRQIRFFCASGIEDEIAARFSGSDELHPVIPSVMENRVACRLCELPGDPQKVGLPKGFPPVNVFLSAPIASPDRVYGWLCLTEKLGGGEFTEEDEGLASLLAAQVGRIYENGTLYAEIKHHADELEQELAERGKIEAALRESEERYRQLIEDARDIIFTLAPDRTIKSANAAFQLASGWTRDEWQNRDITPFIHPDDIPKATAIFQRVVEGAKPPPFEIRFRGKTADFIPLEFTVTPQMTGNRISGIMGIGRDVSERKHLEVQLRQAQKMESIGQLAGGVAHDFNNLLTVIQGHTDLLGARGDLSSNITDSLGEISHASQRAAALTRQLLTFSRQQVIEPRNLDLNEVAADTSKMLNRLLGENIKLRFVPSPVPALIHADPGMMDQILMNLAVNARDAMPRGGTLTVQTSIESVTDEEAALQPDARGGEFVCLAVTDTGTGIAPEHLQKIFEPFFTTKEVGKGTGLGLATVFGIIKQHRGWITVTSQVGRGTTFKIYLPPVAKPSVAPVRAQTDPLPRGGSETILVVEDEEPLRKVVRSALERFGYRVLVAESAVNALRMWHELREPVDLVLSDVVMPEGLTGQDLAEILQAECPTLPVILMTGYTDRITVGEADGRILQILRKPFNLPRVLSLVRETLDRRAAPSPRT